MSYSQGLNFVLSNDVAFALHCAQPVSTADVSVKVSNGSVCFLMYSGPFASIRIVGICHKIIWQRIEARFKF